MQQEGGCMVYRRLMVFMVVVMSLTLSCTAYGDFTMGKTLVINADNFAQDAVNLGGDVYVYGSVASDAVAVGGDVYIENGGVVKGDVVAVGGGVTVRPNGYVGGDAVAVGGKIVIEQGGTVEGEKVDLSMIPVPFVRSHIFPQNQSCPSLGRGLKSIGKLILFGPFFGVLGLMGFAIFTGILLLKILFQCAISVLAIWMAPRHVRAMAAYTRLEPLKVFLAGLVSVILIPIMVILLLVTILGIPLIPVLLLLVFVAKLFGSVGIFLWTGWFLPGSEQRSDIHTALLGVLVLGLIRFIPVAGLIIRFVAGFMAIGVVVMTRFGAGPSRQV